MKLLLYTISDFKPYAIECIELLLSSILKDVSHDFVIVADKPSPTPLVCDVIVDSEASSNYIGCLKYSPAIPRGYDYYVYLDSDILFFDSLSRLIDKDKRYSVVHENELIGKNPWWYFAHSGTDTTRLQASRAINAGSFAFAESEYPILGDVWAAYHQHATANLMGNAQLEQSLLNYYLYQRTRFETDCLHDLTSRAQLHARNYPLQQQKTLYHFCGFTNEMKSKYQVMKAYYDACTNSA